MSEDYTDIIQQVSQLVFEAIQEREENLSSEVKELDGELAKLLRLVGHEVMSMCLNEAAQKVTNSSQKKGVVVHRREKVKYFDYHSLIAPPTSDRFCNLNQRLLTTPLVNR